MFTKSALVLVNVIAIVPLLVGVCANYLSPTHYTTVFAFVGMLFPLWVALNVLFVLFWIVAHRWSFLLSFVALLCCGASVRNTFPVHLTRAKNAGGNDTLCVISYNVAQFNYEKEPRALQLVLEHDPDVVCLQEYAESGNSKYVTAADISKTMKRYPYRYNTFKWTNRYGTRFGIVTFSKYPIIRYRDLSFESKGNGGHVLDLLVGGDTLRLINIHLESFSLSKQDLGQIDGALDNPTSSESVRKAGETVRNTMPKRMRSRAKQAEIIAAEVKDSPYKTIVCGDFNDTPVSYTYHTIRGSMLDAHVEADWGLGNTYFHKGIGICIDHLLYTPDIHADKFNVIDSDASDHRPIRATLSW